MLTTTTGGVTIGVTGVTIGGITVAFAVLTVVELRMVVLAVVIEPPGIMTVVSVIGWILEVVVVVVVLPVPDIDVWLLVTVLIGVIIGGVTMGGVTIVVVPPEIVVFMGVIKGVVMVVPGTTVVEVDAEVEIPEEDEEPGIAVVVVVVRFDTTVEPSG